MTLSEWTPDAGLTVISPNDAPVGGSNPTLELQTPLNTTKYFVPAGNQLNGKDITGIRQGKMKVFVNSKSVSGHANAFFGFLFRYQNVNNHYTLWFRRLGGVMNWSVTKKVAGVENDVLAFIPLTGDILSQNGTWYVLQFTWWSAGGRMWFRLETSTVGGNLFQQNIDRSDAGGDSFTGSGTKIGFRTQSLTTETGDIGWDDLQIFRSIS